MERLGGTSEEEDMDMDLEVKEEDDDDERSRTLVAAEEMGGGFFEEEAASSEQIHIHGMGGRRSRPKEEKERTKLRERHRRAITARILAGLRRHGNYNLRVRADINDVIAALAREAGWVVLPDGTTFPSRSSPTSSQVGKPAEASPLTVAVAVAPQTTPHLKGLSPAGGQISSGDNRQCRLKGVYTLPSAYDGQYRQGVIVGERCNENFSLVASCKETANEKQVIDLPQRIPERDFAGTPYVPVHVMLPLGVINTKCELVDPEGLMKQVRILKSINIDGITVDCWWGIVEAHAPQEYNWHGYRRLFQIVRELKLKLQVVMSFHECGGNIGDDVCIPLPHWVAEIGRGNPDIFFTDREGRRNPECLSIGIDKERVLRGRTALEVYFDYMRSFRVEFDEFFEDGIISAVEVGLGPCGELRYPSYSVKNGWRYPGIGEFQCYDQYLIKSLRKAAEARGHSFWARSPENAGSYNSRPQETAFFCDGGDYDGYYGRFFLGWYSQLLVDHADRVLSLAKLAFEGTCIVAKISGVCWWYKTASHAAELTAGFYNPCNRDGYASIASMLKRHFVTLNLCSELRTLNQQAGFSEALADPEGLIRQVLNAAWDVSIPVASVNSFPCYDRDSYNKILQNAKPLDDPDGRHLSSFTYLRLSPVLMEGCNFSEFERFVKRMHGEAVLDL
ncbi:hypothetical protein M5K25_022082 [Dendrobium thyrsiflorum]|uniref:Beta-amylase n=1 Tax=Dendrobium thyrsiflorum TaxID=117978 RepID=A0ABD0UB76_DENTH